MPGGGVATVKLDFATLERLSIVAREYGLAGAVQHGASTLPHELFHRFPEVETAEIHLATGFQNALFEHPDFPADLMKQMQAWCFANTADERGAGEADDVFLYKTRKKSLGPFKRQLWELPTKGAIIASQEETLRFLFGKLRVNGSKAMVDKYVHAERRDQPMPEALTASSALPR